MWKIKYMVWMVFLLFLTGCSKKVAPLPSNELYDTITKNEQDILYVEQEEKEAAVRLQEVNYGDLSIETTQKVNFYYPNREQILFEEEELSGTLIEFFVKVNDTVEKGDIIASVSYNVDEIHVETLKRLLKRKEEAFKGEEGLREEIKELKEKINSYEKKREMGYIYAPASGVVDEISEILPGSMIYPNTRIGGMYLTDEVYLSIQNDRGAFRYNMEVDLVVSDKSYTDGAKLEIIKAQVISGSDLVTGGLKRDIALLRLLEGDMADLEDKVIKAVGKTKHMKDVLLIDKSAVAFDKRIPYVMEYKEGKLYKRNFISGGTDNDNYMVFDGLEKGMEVIENRK